MPGHMAVFAGMLEIADRMPAGIRSFRVSATAVQICSEGGGSMRKSIARQIAAVFIGLMLLVLMANLAANGFFLERYYISRFEAVLINAYEQIDAHIRPDEVDTEFFEGSFSHITASNNMNLVVLDPNYQIVLRTKDGTSEIMSARIWGYNTGADIDDAKVLREKEHYTIQQKKDARMEELLSFAGEQVLDFTDAEKALLDDYFESMRHTLNEKGYSLPPLEEIVLVKTTMNEE